MSNLIIIIMLQDGFLFILNKSIKPLSLLVCEPAPLNKKMELFCHKGLKYIPHVFDAHR